MRAGAFSLAAILLAATPVSEAFAQGEVIWDSNQCALLGNPLKEATSMEWTGECVDGLIDGEGVLLLLAGNNVLWKYTLTEATASVAQMGYFLGHIDEARIRYDLSECELKKEGSFMVVVTPGTIKVEVPGQWDLTNMAVRWEITEAALSKIDSECPLSAENHSNGYRVVVYKQGGSYPDSRYFEYEVYGHPIVWTERARNQTALMQRQVGQINQERRQAAENVARANAIDASLSLYGEFSTSAGVDQLVLDRMLHSNPFVYDGKRIAAPATFLEMRSRDTALFQLNGEWALLRNVSASDFVSGQEPVMVAVEDLDKEPVQLNLVGERLIVTATLRSFARCSERDCSDYTKWMD